MSRRTFHKSARIRALMIFSQVLLVCFMAYWLRSEYGREEDKLRKDLVIQLERSQEHVSDSMIIATVLKPPISETTPGRKLIKHVIISDSMFVNMRDSLYERDTALAHLIPPALEAGRHGTKTIKQEVVIHQPNMPKGFPTDLAGQAIRTDLVLSGVRTMIKSSSNLPAEVTDLFMRTDTGSLMRTFSKDLTKSGIRVHTRWIRSSPQSVASGIYLSSLSTPGYGLEVGAYRGHLLRNMIPQGLITIILLSLTALAFLATYRSLRAQMQLAAIRNDFISNMSHELKTPVSTVKVALEAISEPEVLLDLPTAREYIRIATLETGRLELLINQALQSSLLEERSSFMQTEQVDLQVLIEELLKIMRPRFTQQQASIVTEVSGSNFTVPADKLQVQGVVLNILDNALKYAGPSPAIKLLLTEDADGVNITINDDGPGIPEIYARRIFEKFFRVPRGNEHSVKGYGLGLSYAFQVMKLHGGSISMQPAPEGGCSFRLRFKKPAA